MSLNLRATPSIAALSFSETPWVLTKGSRIRTSILFSISAFERANELDQTRAAASSFYAKTKDFEQLPGSQISASVDALRPTPGAAGYSQQQQFYDLAQKKADATLKQRTTDPAAAVANSPAVKLANADFANSDPADPASYYPVLRARLNAQQALGMGITSPITNDEAKVYADRLKPVENSDGRLPGESDIVNGVLNDVSKKYGPYAEQAMARVLYRMPVKEGVADLMAKALHQMHTDSSQLPVNETMARQVQMQRDQDRLKTMSGVVTPTTAGTPPPLPESGSLRPFSQAVDMLRFDPDRLMPAFVKRFGPASVPPDLQDRIPQGLLPDKAAAQ